MEMEDTKPTLKLIAKRDFESVRGKYGFRNDDEKEALLPKIEGAKPLDVLALIVAPGSGLKILDVRILNESSPVEFIKLLKEGAVIEGISS